MEYMFAPGFLGTKAPFFMDLMTLIVALLPLLIYLGILLARKGLYDLHHWYQWTLFLFALVVFGWFEYGVRAGGGFGELLDSGVFPRWAAISFLVLHIVIAILTLLWWSRTLFRAHWNFRKHMLPGGYSLRHIRSGVWTAAGIFLTSLSGIWVYLLLFVLR
ncbi:DUF420 domain-containing protein [Nitratifractor sp.]